MPLNVQDAAKAVNAEAQKRNSKIVDQVPALINKLAAEHRIYIFNVGSVPHSRNLGSLGNYYVPPRSEGQRVGEPCIIDGMVRETITNDMNKMDNRFEEGLQVAHDVMFIGRGYTPDLNRENYGLFIHDGPVAPPDKIAKAEKKWHKHLSDLIAKADNLEKSNKREEISNNPIFALAAAELGITRPWCSESKQMAECPSCGESINQGSAICRHCDATLDEEKARKYFPKRFQEDKRGPGRPVGS
jgi:hypothetical protein